jgi:hypothetical protein
MSHPKKIVSISLIGFCFGMILTLGTAYGPSAHWHAEILFILGLFITSLSLAAGFWFGLSEIDKFDI